MTRKGRNKRKDADARSRALRRRFYKGAAVATAVYVVLSIAKFHAQLPYLSYELVIIWAVFLLCYASYKEVLRWNDISDKKSYSGEFWALIVVGGALWMIVWNIGRVWFFRLPQLPFPEDYVAATIETLVLYTISAISAFLYKNKKEMPVKIIRRPCRKKSNRAEKNRPETSVPESNTVLPRGIEARANISPSPPEEKDKIGGSV